MGKAPTTPIVAETHGRITLAVCVIKPQGHNADKSFTKYLHSTTDNIVLYCL